MPLDALRDLAGPGVVFLLLAFWLVRKAWRASRTERQLEWERALPAEPPAPRPHLRALPPVAEVNHARADHLALLATELAATEVLWVRSLGAHVAWLEKLPAGEHALRVALIKDGQLSERWKFD